MRSLVTLSLLCVMLYAGSSKLVQVAFIFRHGARYPINGNYDGEQQRINWGELLPVGMRQHYNLGRQLRREYIDELQLLGPNFNHTEFYIRSTDVNRTITSAQSQLMGMFPNGPLLPQGIDEKYVLPPFAGIKNYLQGESALPNFVQPIPIHIEPKDYDVLEAECVNDSKLKKQDSEDLADIIQDFDDSTQEIREQICAKFNQKSCSSNKDMYSIYGVYISDLHQGRPVPDLTEEEAYMLELMSSFRFYYAYAGSNYSRFISQPFFKDVLKHFSAKTKAPSSPLKWLSYSAHDSNVIIYARTLNFSSAECVYQTVKQNQTGPCQMQPQYASNILFELHQNEESLEFFVKVKYNGVYQQICGGQLSCSYNEFKATVESSLANQDEFDRVCKASKSMEQSMLFARPVEVSDFSLLSIIIMIQMIAICWLAYRVHQKSTKAKTIDQGLAITELSQELMA